MSARRTKRTVFNAAPEYDVDVLQNSIVRAAEDGAPLPERFHVSPHLTKPQMIITDTVSGRRVEVALYAYGAVREVLTALLSDEVNS